MGDAGAWCSFSSTAIRGAQSQAEAMAYSLPVKGFSRQRQAPRTSTPTNGAVAKHHKPPRAAHHGGVESQQTSSQMKEACTHRCPMAQQPQHNRRRPGRMAKMPRAKDQHRPAEARSRFSEGDLERRGSRRPSGVRLRFCCRSPQAQARRRRSPSVPCGWHRSNQELSVSPATIGHAAEKDSKRQRSVPCLLEVFAPANQHRRNHSR